jgi:DNA-binding transcriptional regulator YiaG
MPNVGAILKSEIARLSKKVVREHVGPIHTTTNVHRKQLAALKKQVAELQRELTLLRRATERARPEPEAANGTQYRFSAKGLKSLRGRLGLSAEDFGRLLDVGGQSVYNWENEKTTPRAVQLPAIAELRGIGKREARRRVEALQNGSGN